jgi:uncharacterized membrane protein
MVFLAFILIVVVLLGLIFLFRAAGRMQRPSPQERMEHSKRDQHGPGPRTTGLN